MPSKVIRKFIEDGKLRVFLHEFIKMFLRGKYVSKVRVIRTALLDRVIIYAARPRLISEETKVKLAKILEWKFNLKNPAIEIVPVENPFLDAEVMAERIVLGLERYGVRRFKDLAYRALQDMLKNGAIGAEVVIAGKVPGQRGRTWRFKAGNLRKTGTIGQFELDRGFNVAFLQPGTVGVHVTILRPDAEIPDIIEFKKPEEIKIEEIKEIDPEIAKKMEKLLEAKLLAQTQTNQ